MKVELVGLRNLERVRKTGKKESSQRSLYYTVYPGTYLYLTIDNEPV